MRFKCNRNCGYCGKTLYCTEEEFLIHVNYCEKECCDKNYGELDGDAA